MENTFYNSIEYDLSHNMADNSIMENYKIEKEIYRSNNSYIYLITNLTSNKLQILKAIKLIDGVEFDIELVKNIKHGNLPEIYDYYYSDIFLYLVKEYIVGDNLEEIINTSGPLTEEVGLDYIKQLVNVLDHLHNYKDSTIIYRDLKPSNIIVTASGKLMLIDLITLREKKDQVSTDTFYIGSHGYAAPEQYGFLQSSEKADIYALGACFYFIMTGKHPVNDSGISQQLNDVESVSEKVKKVISKATSFSPDKRYDSITEITEELNNKLTIINRKMILVSCLGILSVIVMVIILFQNIDKTAQLSVSEETNENSIKEIFKPVSSGDINIDDMLVIESGILFELSESNIMNIRLEREEMSEELKAFKYISVSSDYAPFMKDYLGDMASQAIIKGYGFEEYDSYGFGSVLDDRTHLGIIIYDEWKYPIGYYFYNNIETYELIMTDEGSVNFPLEGMMLIEGDISIEYNKDYASITVLGDYDFSKIAVWGTDNVLDERLALKLKADVEKGAGVYDYLNDRFDTGYGDIGSFLGQSWMIFLLDDQLNVVSEYAIYND